MSERWDYFPSGTRRSTFMVYSLSIDRIIHVDRADLVLLYKTAHLFTSKSMTIIYALPGPHEYIGKENCLNFSPDIKPILADYQSPIVFRRRKDVPAMLEVGISPHFNPEDTNRTAKHFRFILRVVRALWMMEATQVENASEIEHLFPYIETLNTEATLKSSPARTFKDKIEFVCHRAETVAQIKTEIDLALEDAKSNSSYRKAFYRFLYNKEVMPP